MEDIRPAKPLMPPKKPPSIQKSVQQLTQEFRDLLSEKVRELQETPQYARVPLQLLPLTSQQMSAQPTQGLVGCCPYILVLSQLQLCLCACIGAGSVLLIAGLYSLDALRHCCADIVTPPPGKCVLLLRLTYYVYMPRE